MIPQPQPPEPPKRPYTLWSALLGLFLCCGLPGMIAVSLYRGARNIKHDIQGPACRRNLEAIAAATAKFSLANAGRLPGKNWMDDLKPFVEDDGVFTCPLGGDHGYAMNEKYVGGSMATVPSEVPLFFDSTLAGRNAVGPLTTLPLPGRHLHQGQDATHETWRNNVVFATGGARSTPSRFEEN